MSKFEDLKNKLYEEIKIDETAAIDKNVEKVLIVASGVAAAIATQPIPFADFPVLTAIEIIMVKRIGEIYGFDFSWERSKEIFGEIVGVVGMAKVAQTAILTGYKTFIPFAGGLFTIPLVFGSCFAIGKVADYYFKCRFEGISFDAGLAKRIFRAAKKEGEAYGKNKEHVREID